MKNQTSWDPNENQSKSWNRSHNMLVIPAIKIYQVYFAIAGNAQWLYDFGKDGTFFIAEPETTETFCTQSASLQHDVSQHKPATAACCCAWLESVLNDNDSDIPIPSRMIVSTLGSFCTLVLGPYDMRPLLQPMLAVEDSTFQLRT